MTALGRGLQSLIPSKITRPPALASQLRSAEQPREVPTAQIRANPLQPRSTVDHRELEELVDSIREHGILQPLVVSKRDGGYELIAGERRLQSAKIIGLKVVPVIIRDASRQQKLELALVENLQRQDLNPIDGAIAYRRLIDEFNLTQEQVGKRIGKSRESVANVLRLLSLPQDLQQYLRDRRLTEGHAKVLLTAPTPEAQRKLALQMVQGKLSVRRSASMVVPKKSKRHARGAADHEIIEFESVLQEQLGTRVTINRSGHRGSVVVSFYSDEELAALVEKLTS